AGRSQSASAARGRAWSGLVNVRPQGRLELGCQRLRAAVVGVVVSGSSLENTLDRVLLKCLVAGRTVVLEWHLRSYRSRRDITTLMKRTERGQARPRRYGGVLRSLPTPPRPETTPPQYPKDHLLPP